MKTLFYSFIVFSCLCFCFLSSCSDDDDNGVGTARMLPSVMEHIEGEDESTRMELQYDANDRISKITRKYEDEPAYSYTVSYATDGKIDKITYADGVHLFRYEQNTIFRYNTALQSNAVLQRWRHEGDAVDDAELPVPDTLWLNDKKQLVKYAIPTRGDIIFNWRYVKTYEYDNRGNLVKSEEKSYSGGSPSFTYISEAKYDAKNGALRMVKSPQWFLVLYIGSEVLYNNPIENSHVEYNNNGDIIYSSKGTGANTYNNEGFPEKIAFTFDRGSDITITIEYIKR